MNKDSKHFRVEGKPIVIEEEEQNFVSSYKQPELFVDWAYIEAPDCYTEPHPSQKIVMPTIFLAGGITGCPDWQSAIRTMLRGVYIFNPRRKDFPIGDPKAALEQIKWEHEHLRLADAILFWFPCETLCPIVLYELGAWSMTDKQIFVGVHPDYKRKQDVEIQTKLARPDAYVVYSVQALAYVVNGWVNNEA